MRHVAHVGHIHPARKTETSLEGAHVAHLVATH